MANALTGDFDVVAQFTLPAAHRVLAAMHGGGRFPHSVSVRVGDVDGIAGLPPARSITAVVDQFGEPVDDPLWVAQPPGSLRSADVLPTDPALSGVDVVVNGSAGRDALLEPSTLGGIAQVQLSPPSLSLPDDSGAQVVLDTQIRVRYLADPDTRPLPEFFTGAIRTTVTIDRVVSQVGNNIEVDLRSRDLGIGFIRAFSDVPMNSPGDERAIERAIHSWIRTRFQPSSTPLPQGIAQIAFSALAGQVPALCALLNRRPIVGDPASVAGVFVTDEDQFALAVSKELIVAEFRAVIDQVFRVRTINLGTYTVFVDTLDLDIPAPFRRIVFTVKGRANTDSIWPNFSFEASQAFTLQLVDGEAQLAFLGSLSSRVTSSSNVFSGVATPFVSALIRRQLEQRRNDFLNRVQPRVTELLSAQKNLGGFLESLMNPLPKPGTAPPELHAALGYTSFDIRREGIVLHGFLDVDESPGPQVKIERIAAYRRPQRAPQGRFGGIARVEAILSGIEPSVDDYSALRSWVPGGRIDEFQWSYKGRATLRVETNRFALLNPPPPPTSTRPTSLLGPVPICLTITGARLSSSGPVIEEPVSATGCLWGSSPLIDLQVFTGRGLRVPDITLARSTVEGRLEVVGHASPWESGSGGNLVVHFPDERSAAALGSLVRAVRESERPDCATGVLVVLTPEQMRRVPFTEGVIYAEDAEKQWERALSVGGRPATFLIGPSGDIAWRHEEELTDGALTAALGDYLIPGGLVLPRLLRAAVRNGQPPPNFVFEHVAGRQSMLRKLIGREVVLVFWKSGSRPSRDAVRELQARVDGGDGPVVLALNDGDPPEVARRAADESGMTALVVMDPEGEIARAYAVCLWPTVIFVGANGLVRETRYGREMSDTTASASTPAGE